jgi:hypothetical protein
MASRRSKYTLVTRRVAKQAAPFHTSWERRSKYTLVTRRVAHISHLLAIAIPGKVYPARAKTKGESVDAQKA